MRRDDVNPMRALGSVDPNSFRVAQTTRLVHSLEPAPGIRFSARPRSQGHTNEKELESPENEIFAHKSGVKCLAIDKKDGQVLVSAGADPSIHIWNLESRGSELNHIHRPSASIGKLSHPDAHTHAITSLSVYPFDYKPSSIFSTSYDGTLKLSAIQPSGITPTETFKLNCTPYAHSFSSQPDSKRLVAVATSEQYVRLVDPRAGLSIHQLPGHTGAVLSVDWAPHNPHLLASSSVDNKALIFDVRRGGFNAAIASLDMDDPTGLVLPDPTVPVSALSQIRPAYSRNARAHSGPVTGIRWTSNGRQLVTAGQDARIRVWDAASGANTLAHFGPRVRNGTTSNLGERAPLLIPGEFTAAGHETLLWPNFGELSERGEIFMFELREGTFIKMLKVPGVLKARPGPIQPSALRATRINDMVLRGCGGSGEGIELFTAHGDGVIRSWVSSEADAEPTEAEEEVLSARKRKRDVLDDIYKTFFEAGESGAHN
ncbi:uncharacterized protein N7483_009203 [Penicillium malachiteum]|uniref:uncharacterized protein n=1 Tax=Penicillium malachiteum TaxID=1324776 RepID=UPI0025480D49|nr:uncharacterized protein N7483_009203 [Penicillium malachiteum]KAJ5721269.1 hypothetical protein N7483_009203 [Penicillium malachiteum]